MVPFQHQGGAPQKSAKGATLYQPWVLTQGVHF